MKKMAKGNDPAQTAGVTPPFPPPSLSLSLSVSDGIVERSLVTLAPHGLAVIDRGGFSQGKGHQKRQSHLNPAGSLPPSVSHSLY
jgi:hypothetical protein